MCCGGDGTARDTLRPRFGLDPGDVAAACLIAEIGAMSGQHEAVSRLLRDSLATAPDYLPARLRCAEALHRAGLDSG